MIDIHRHCLGSEPPTGSVDDDLLPDGDSFYHTLGSPVKYLLDIIHNHFKPTLDEALPHLRLQAYATLLQPSADDLLFGGGFGFVTFKNLNVIGHFVKGLVVRMLL